LARTPGNESDAPNPDLRRTASFDPQSSHWRPTYANSATRAFHFQIGGVEALS